MKNSTRFAHCQNDNGAEVKGAERGFRSRRGVTDSDGNSPDDECESEGASLMRDRVASDPLFPSIGRTAALSGEISRLSAYAGFNQFYSL